MSAVRYICSVCGAARDEMDVASWTDGGQTRWFCHPADAVEPTCYMKFTMFGNVLTSRPVVHFHEELP